jgi:S1-C subfamily serine protease
LGAVANFADEFDEIPEKDQSGQILPLADRLWRHPSEAFKGTPSLDPIAVRHRWLQTQPTRASAWTAGLVGALLATGLVVLGTHLATALTGDSSGPALSSTTVNTTAATHSVVPTIAIIGQRVATQVAHVSSAMAEIEIMTNGSSSKEFGLVINRAGFLVIPSSGLSDASSILVTLGNGVQYVGTIAGNDAHLGISLIHINGSDNLSSATIATGTDFDSGSLAVAVTSLKGDSAITTLHAFATPPVVDNVPITGAFTSDLRSSVTTNGTPLINGEGHVAGMVISEINDQLIIAPGSALAAATGALMNEQVFSVSTIGITDQTSSNSSTTPAGARITSVSRGSTGATAGLSDGDVIVGVNGLTIDSESDLDTALRNASPKSPLVLTVYYDLVSHTIIIPATVATTP